MALIGFLDIKDIDQVADQHCSPTKRVDELAEVYANWHTDAAVELFARILNRTFCKSCAAANPTRLHSS